MFKNIKKQTLRKQAGFTLVELSIVLVVVGLLFAAVVKGQEMVDLAKSVKLLNDIKNVEVLIQAHATTKGRLPGDCNGDGVIDMAADAVTRADADNSLRADMYDFTATKPAYAASGASVTSATEACKEIGGIAITGTTTTDLKLSANTWINDLKISGLISDSVVNRTYAKMVNEDMVFVGHVTEINNTTAGGGQYNAIVVHNVSQWMARYISTAINGTGAVAGRNRVRSLKMDGFDGQYEDKWDTTTTATASGAAGTNNQRNSMVTLVYFFDRIPATP